MSQSKWIDRVKNSRVGNLLRGLKHAATGATPANASGDPLTAWLENGHQLLTTAEKQFKAAVAQSAGRQDWEAWMTEVTAKQTAVRGPGLRCAKELQRVLDTTEELRMQVGKEFFEHLERTMSRSLKNHIRALPDGLLKKTALQYFLQWKDVAMSDALKANAVGWNRPLQRSANFGRGMDSRIVEIPLAFEQGDFAKPGKVLDAGCALNHGFMHDLMPATGAKLTHMTQSSEKEPTLFAADRFSYVFGDLRNIDFKDNSFDRVLCISTLEHIGSDNSKYFAGGGQESRKDTYHDALREMLRVVKPGGVLFVTFPYGPYQDMDWYQILGPEQVGRMVEVVSGHKVEVKYYFSDGYWYEGPADVVKTMPNEIIEDGVAALRVVKK